MDRFSDLDQILKPFWNGKKFLNLLSPYLATLHWHICRFDIVKLEHSFPTVHKRDLSDKLIQICIPVVPRAKHLIVYLNVHELTVLTRVQLMSPWTPHWMSTFTCNAAIKKPMKMFLDCWYLILRLIYWCISYKHNHTVKILIRKIDKHLNMCALWKLSLLGNTSAETELDKACVRYHESNGNIKENLIYRSQFMSSNI